MVAFGNPVEGLIRPPGSPLIVGNMRVTATFADHVAGKRPPGVDCGDGRCGAKVIAQCDGIVSLAELVGYPVKNALTVRYRSTRHPDYEPAATHLASISLNPRTKARWTKGDLIYRGEQVGVLGMTGASACHLHFGLKQLINGAWVEIDGWPFLEQNGATETDMLQGTNSVRIVNRQTHVIGDGTRFRPSPGTRDPELTKYPAGTLFYPDYRVQGGLALGSTSWLAGWGMTPKGTEFGYMAEGVLEPLTPIEQSGHSDQELVDARAAGVQAAAELAATAK